jgi:hypothetical protein
MLAHAPTDLNQKALIVAVGAVKARFSCNSGCARKGLFHQKSQLLTWGCIDTDQPDL